MQMHDLVVPRTARYAALGPPEARDVWVVLHGYGQQAADFLRPFRALDDGTRRLVAPEALSRFYAEGMQGRVGASWMTSEARLNEISDYVTYLDALADALALTEQHTLHVLGFSQGAATACRWALLGTAPVTRLTLWAGRVPPDLDLDAHAAGLADLDLTVVVGTQDPYLDAEAVEAEHHRLLAHDVPHRLRRFDAGHRLHTATLQRLAAAS
jgi:predicted esterase